jgi:hypothetical protein
VNNDNVELIIVNIDNTEKKGNDDGVVLLMMVWNYRDDDGVELK